MRAVEDWLISDPRPINGYRVFFNGKEVVASGTSAVAPLWGAFIALINADAVVR